jgi:hypothetical protein
MARYNNAPYIQINEGDHFGEIDIVLKHEEQRPDNASSYSPHCSFLSNFQHFFTVMATT